MFLHVTDSRVLAQGRAARAVVDVNVFKSSFYYNSAADEGGAVYMESASVALQDIMMESNACAPSRGLGGALASTWYTSL